MEPQPESSIVCPTNCPNRRGTGIFIFGKNFDPLEILLLFLIVLVLGVPAIKDSWSNKDFDVAKGGAWIAAITGACAAVKVLPTQKIDPYRKIG